MKQIGLTVILLIITTLVFGQRYRYYGSKIRPEKGAAGLFVGASTLGGDVKSGYGPQGGIYYRAHLSPVLDVKVMASYGQVLGADTKTFTAIASNDALNGTYDPQINYLSIGKVYPNFQFRYFDMTLNGAINILPLFSRKYKGHVNPYIWGGVGFLSYLTKINALDANGSMYPYQNITSTNPSEVSTQLNQMWDNTYESFGEYDNSRSARLLVNGGVGLRVRINERFAVGVEGGVKFSNDDSWDSQRWQGNGTLSANSDMLVNGSAHFEVLF